VIADELKDENRALAKREAQTQQLERDLAASHKTKDLVVMYLRSGTCPKYIAQRYGVDLERCERYVAALKAQQEQKREREQSARGNSSISQDWEVDNPA
jgi:hypothetical protein